MSLRVSVSRSKRQHGGHGSHQGWARKGLWSQMGSRADKSSGQQGRASNDPCQGRSVCHGAALWCVELGYLDSGLEPASVVHWKWCAPHPSGSLDKCLGFPDGEGEFPQEPIYGPCYSADHMCRYLRCFSLPDVSSMT